MAAHATGASDATAWRERLRDAERDVVNAVVRGRELSAILELACRRYEALDPGSLCSILLVDREGRRLSTGGAPSLPKAFNDAFSALKSARM